jgi:hypothetical protein
MPLIYQYLIYVAFYTVQIHFDFYHFYRNPGTYSTYLAALHTQFYGQRH